MQLEERFLDEQAVSEITGIKVRTLRKWRLQGRGPGPLVRGHPLGHGGPGHAKHLGRLGVGHPVPDRLHGPPPEIFLRCGGQRACIGGRHRVNVAPDLQNVIYIML